MKFYINWMLLILLAIIFTGCFTRPVNVSLLPSKQPIVAMYAGIPNFGVLDAEVYNYRGGQPKTKADFDFLVKAHVKVILKLDTDTEGNDSEAELRGIKVVKIPITFKQQIFGPIPTKDIKDFWDKYNENVYVHCKRGQDRTGFACMIYNMKEQDYDKEGAINDMLSHGFHKILYGLWKEAKDYQP